MPFKYPSRNLFLFILIMFAILCINFPAIVAALHHHYFVYEQDAYMHLVLALDLLKNHDWYQHFTTRVNAPFGAELHGWTQAVNGLLVAGALGFHIILPTEKALYLWGFILPMLGNAIAAFGMYWAIGVFKPSNYQRFFVIAAFILNPFLGVLFAPLRVDYDFLLITLSIYYWGFLLRLNTHPQKTWATGAAIMAGLGVWASIGFMIIVLIGIAYMFWQSLIKNQLSSAVVNTFMRVLAITFTACIFLEHRHFFEITHDILSIVHLTVILLLLLFFNLYQSLIKRRSPLLQLVFTAILLCFIFLLLNYLYPGFYQGPYANIDPYLLGNFFSVLSEFYSPFRIDNALALALLFYFFVGMAFCYYTFLDNRAEWTSRGLLTVATIITTLLTVYMYRWHDFAVPLTILLVSFFVKAICDKKISSLSKILFVILMALIPRFILLLAKDYMPPAHQQCQAQFYRMMQDGYFDSPVFAKDKTLMIHSNYGPLILYSTHFSIIATNDHHNPQGVKDSFNFFKANQPAAYQIVAHRKVDLFLVCPSEYNTSFAPHETSWLKSLALPQQYSQWQLYRIVSHSPD